MMEFKQIDIQCSKLTRENGRGDAARGLFLDGFPRVLQVFGHDPKACLHVKWKRDSVVICVILLNLWSASNSREKNCSLYHNNFF